SFKQQVSWAQALSWSFGDWYGWALLSPIVFWVCRRFRFERRSWPRAFAAHIFGGLLLSGVHATMCAVLAGFQGWMASKPVGFGSTVQGLLANRTYYNLTVYGLIVCAWHTWDYYRKFREREAQAIELTGRLAQAQLQA